MCREVMVITVYCTVVQGPSYFVAQSPCELWFRPEGDFEIILTSKAAVDVVIYALGIVFNFSYLGEG
jgi:hypothetical protein